MSSTLPVVDPQENFVIAPEIFLVRKLSKVEKGEERYMRER